MLERFVGGTDTGNPMTKGHQVPANQEKIVGIVVNNKNEERFGVVLRHRQTIGKSLPKLAISSTWRTLPLAFARDTVLPDVFALSRSISNMPRAELSR